MSEEWLATLSKRCARGMVPGIDLLQRVCTVLQEMLSDRGYEMQPITVANMHAAVNNGDIVVTGRREDGRVVAFLDTEERTGIKRVRALLDAYADDTIIIIISIDGLTPFSKREIASNQRVQVFLVRELLHNVTRHALVPPHRALDADEAARVSKLYNIMPKHWMLLPQTDPVARYYAWPVGTIVRIERKGLSQDTHTVYRRVTRASAGG